MTSPRGGLSGEELITSSVGQGAGISTTAKTQVEIQRAYGDYVLNGGTVGFQQWVYSTYGLDPRDYAALPYGTTATTGYAGPGTYTGTAPAQTALTTTTGGALNAPPGGSQSYYDANGYQWTWDGTDYIRTGYTPPQVTPEPPADTSITPYQQAGLTLDQGQLDLQRAQLDQRIREWEAENARAGTLTPAQQANLELQRQQLETEVNQFNANLQLNQQQFTYQQQRDEADRQEQAKQRLAQIAAQGPQSWLRYALEAGQTPVTPDFFAGQAAIGQGQALLPGAQAGQALPGWQGLPQQSPASTSGTATTISPIALPTWGNFGSNTPTGGSAPPPATTGGTATSPPANPVVQIPNGGGKFDTTGWTFYGPQGNTLTSPEDIAARVATYQAPSQPAPTQPPPQQPAPQPILQPTAQDLSSGAYVPSAQPTYTPPPPMPAPVPAQPYTPDVQGTMSGLRPEDLQYIMGYKGGGMPQGPQAIMVGEQGPEIEIIPPGQQRQVIPIRPMVTGGYVDNRYANSPDDYIPMPNEPTQPTPYTGSAVYPGGQSGQVVGEQYPMPTTGGVVQPNQNTLPPLLNPSLQYFARMSPDERAQYFGYQQMQTGRTPETEAWRLWSMAPPSGENRGFTYRR